MVLFPNCPSRLPHLSYISKNWLFLIWFEVLTVVTVKIIVFWNVTSCSPCRSLLTFRRNVQSPSSVPNSKRTKWVTGKRRRQCLLLTGCILGLLFSPEHGGSTFPRDLDEPDYTASHPRRYYFSLAFLYCLPLPCQEEKYVKWRQRCKWKWSEEEPKNITAAMAVKNAGSIVWECDAVLCGKSLMSYLYRTSCPGRQ
jgi:hypothetical protein